MIDLHTHSTASDGTTPPADVVRRAGTVGLSVLALTDHDTTGGWDEAAAALPRGLALVRGAELSCRSGSGPDAVPLHLLAYLFDRTEPSFAAARARLRDSRVGRAARMVQRLQADGYAVTQERVDALAAGGTVGRPHVARALVEIGAVGSVDEAFGPQWLATGGRYYVDKEELDVLDAIAMVRRAGGVCVFAHPLATKRGRTVGDDVVAAMAQAGLAGLEVDHPDHAEHERAHVRGLARDLGLVVTGSSDYHGTNKAQDLGAETTARDAYEALVAGATGAEVLGV